MMPATLHTEVRRRGRTRGGCAPRTGRARRSRARPRAVERRSRSRPNDPIVAYFQSANGPVDTRGPRHRLARARAAARRGRRAGGSTRQPGRAGRRAQPGPAPLASRSTRPTTASCSTSSRPRPRPRVRVAQLVREQEAEARARERIEQELRVAHADPAEVPAQEAARLRRLARRGATTGPRERSAATSTTSSSCPTAGSGSSSATSPTRACRRRWSWRRRRAMLRAMRRRLVAPGRGARAGRTSCCAPTCRRRCSSPACTRVLDPASGKLRFANAGHNLPYVRNRRRRRRAACDRHAARACMPGIDVRGEGGRPRARRECAAPQRRDRRGARRRSGRCSASRACKRRRRRRARRRRPDRPACSPNSNASPGRRLGAGGRHHARGAQRAQEGAAPEAGGRDVRSRSRASPATSGWPASGSPRWSRPSGSRPHGSSV